MRKYLSRVRWTSGCETRELAEISTNSSRRDLFFRGEGRVSRWRWRSTSSWPYRRGSGRRAAPVSSRSTCEVRSKWTWPSSFSGVRWGTASLRYDDGKTLKGMGTRASKSRLADLWASFLECLSNWPQLERRQEKTIGLLFLSLGGEERKNWSNQSRYWYDRSDG